MTVTRHSAPPLLHVPTAPIEISALLKQAKSLQLLGDLRGAESCFRQILRYDPENVSSLNGMGNLAVAARQYDLAVSFHRRAVMAAPKDPGLLNDLANSLILAGESQNALPHLRKALKALPRLRPALLNLARAYRSLDEPDKALTILEKLATPDGSEGAGGQVEVMLERAVTLAQVGRAAEAHSLFRKVIRIRPTDPKAINGLATCHSATANDNDLGAVEAAIADSRLTPLQRTVAHRAAGKILEDLGRFDEAFAQFKQGNEVSAKPFDMKRHEKFVAGSIRLFTPKFFTERTGFGDASEKPVFVVGLPRSGTTLIEQILASHPQITGLGELPDIERSLRKTVPEPFGDEYFFDHLQKLSPEVSHEQAKKYLATISSRGGTKARAIDKMPHNFLVLGWIAMLFPKARVIHCKRDPMDVCVSCYAHHFSEAHAYSNDLGMLGKYHRSYEGLMHHWSKTLPISILDVHYEDVVANLEQTSRKMIAHLGLEWSKSCLDFHKRKRIIQTPSQWQVRQPIYNSSVGRWRRYESHLQPLIESLRPEAGKTTI